MSEKEIIAKKMVPGTYLCVVLSQWSDAEIGPYMWQVEINNQTIGLFDDEESARQCARDAWNSERGRNA